MNWEQFAAKVMNVSKIGLKFSTDPYAIENYKGLEELSIEMLNEVLPTPIEKNMYERDIYPTPNVSVRVMVFNEEHKLLMVKEKDDGGWCVPGGWCDVFLSSSQNGVKEVKEESGLDVKIDRLLGVFQREKYKDYPTIVSEYVHYYSATILGGELQTNQETTDIGFFDFEELPNISRKNTKDELNKAYAVYCRKTDVQFD